MTICAAIALGFPALAACGGASNTSSAFSRTSREDQSAATAVTASGTSNSTPISSARYRRLITLAASQRGLSPPIAAKVADCLIKKETAQGYRTVADVARDASTRQQAVQDGAQCTSEALPGG
jgi:hypothetical protein